MENKVEIWKFHPDIVGIEVSSLGRVRTLDRIVSSEKITRFLKGRVLKQCDDGKGYLKVNISINGEMATKKIHRLVAQTFIPNPDNLPMLNHKNCVRNDNRVSNLEWCDNSYNMQYREKFGEASGIPVFALNLDTLKVSRFSSQTEASRVLGVYLPNINHVIKGRINQTGGYWFVNDDGHAVDVIKSKLHDIGKTELKIKYRAAH